MTVIIKEEVMNLSWSGHHCKICTGIGYGGSDVNVIFMYEIFNKCWKYKSINKGITYNGTSVCNILLWIHSIFAIKNKK